MQNYLLFFALFLFAISCNSPQEKMETAPPQQNIPATPKVKLPEVLEKGLAAHGGLDRWNEMKMLEFSIMKDDKKETHLTQLKNRKARISHEDYTVGFDGKEVWVSPNKAAFGKGSARFYHNLRFYFVGIPFLLADPGINYETMPASEINGVTYNPVKITYNDGVGDAPDDYYIAHFNPETNLMDYLLYTVTYYNKEPSDKFSALQYEWQEVNGLMLPKVMRGFKFEDGKIGEMRYETPVLDITISDQAPDEQLFVMPAAAEIDSLK